MEPGHEDREYIMTEMTAAAPIYHASMEPGHEDREYRRRDDLCGRVQGASMEPGHEDREYRPDRTGNHAGRPSLNGARS